MAEFSIDQSNLPAVNAVCRQFAVREDHSLAHNLQEQEIEHHLASNVQRNRLVQNDLQVAKKLQEEENRKAQIRLQRHQREMEHHDNQMAQVIQDELSLENEKRRRQEEKDEAIARKLQEKEEKLRRKHQQAVDREPSEAVFEGNGGLKPRIEYGVNDAMHGISRMTTKDLEWKDAELARKLQEEEIRATQISERAAQLAQDEEIARLLTEDEKKQVHRKSKEKDSARRAEEDRRKGSSDWRKHEVERKVTCTVHDTSEYVKPRWDELESPTVKPERPARLPAHRAGSEDLDHRLSSQRPSRPGPRSAESSQKVSYYRQ
ncbi:coiled-coil domain-containing protein 50 isoform X3 [Amblyraja radiata]|uniref:coiled-coil domain-containing protein 50 isoform X3 n=1 Tax=Amblyraja radiata TaxID=386614 RepID=UPI001403E361|nr:coiled-coil domain-containing protein 50 isoform X3 [Amblyraja radiata]